MLYLIRPEWNAYGTTEVLVGQGSSSHAPLWFCSLMVCLFLLCCNFFVVSGVPYFLFYFRKSQRRHSSSPNFIFPSIDSSFHFWIKSQSSLFIFMNSLSSSIVFKIVFVSMPITVGVMTLLL